MNQILKDTIEDLVIDFIVHDRKEDVDLPRGKIEELINNGDVTVDEIVNVFKEHLINWGTDE